MTAIVNRNMFVAGYGIKVETTKVEGGKKKRMEWSETGKEGYRSEKKKGSKGNIFCLSERKKKEGNFRPRC